MVQIIPQNLTPLFDGIIFSRTRLTLQRRKVDSKSLPEAVDASACALSSLTSLERVVARVWEDRVERQQFNTVLRG